MTQFCINNSKALKVKKLSIRIKKEIMKDIAIKFFFKMKKNKKNKLHMIKITSRNHRKGCSDVQAQSRYFHCIEI